MSPQSSADSSPLSDVVDFQCQECIFKVAGTAADVEIARRTHRHANLPLISLDPDERQRLWKNHFEEPPSFPGLDTSRLPQPYPRFFTSGVILGILIVTGASALFSRWLVDTRYPSLGGWFHGMFMLMIVAGLVYALMRYENDRRAANIRRFRVVSECTHHIRNAVQVLIFHDSGLERGSPAISRQIADAVHRIELTLSEVFPKML